MTQFYSRNDVNYSGDVYSIPFDYIDKKEVKVYIDDELWTKWHFLSEHQLTLDEVPEDIRYSNIISVRRETNITDKVVTYNNNSLLNKENLNKSQDQLLYAVQEIYDNNTQFEIDVDNTLIENRAEMDAVIEANKQEVLAMHSAFETEINTVLDEVRDAAEKVNELESAVDTAVTAANTATNQAIRATAQATEASQAVQQSKELLQTTQATVNSLANKDLSNLSEQGQAKFDEKVNVDDMYEINIGLTLGLFDTILKDHVLTYEESKGLALQGTYVYKEALAGSRYGYPDFYAKVIEEYNQATTTETVNGVTVKVHSNGHKFYDIANKTAIDEFFNTMGTAWFYGVDTENECVFLPRNNYLTSYIVDGDNTVSVYGTGKSLGLTDGNTNAGFSHGGSAHFDVDTSFYDVTLPSASGSKNGYVTNYILGVSKDGTKSGLTGNVNLQNTQNGMYLYICVGNTTNYEGVTDVVNQGMEILEQINEGFVPKDSMSEVPCITETYVNGTSWYRVWSDGWKEQGGVTEAGTVTFLKAFSNTNYLVLVNNREESYNANSQSDNLCQPNTLKTTSFNTNGRLTMQWYACGY